MSSILRVRGLKNVLLFDGVCNFCNGLVNFVIRMDPAKKFKFASIQSQPGQELLRSVGAPTDLSTVVYVRAEQDPDSQPSVFVKSDAALMVAGELGLPSLIVRCLLFIPRGIRDAVYDIVARNRYTFFGKKDTCRVGSRKEADERFLAQL